MRKYSQTFNLLRLWYWQDLTDYCNLKARAARVQMTEKEFWS